MMKIIFFKSIKCHTFLEPQARSDLNDDDDDDDDDNNKEEDDDDKMMTKTINSNFSTLGLSEESKYL